MTSRWPVDSRQENRTTTKPAQRRRRHQQRTRMTSSTLRNQRNRSPYDPMMTGRNVTISGRYIPVQSGLIWPSLPWAVLPPILAIPAIAQHSKQVRNPEQNLRDANVGHGCAVNTQRQQRQQHQQHHNKCLYPIRVHVQSNPIQLDFPLRMRYLSLYTYTYATQYPRNANYF